MKNKITEFSNIVKSIDNNNETVISVTVKAQDCNIVSIPVEEKSFRKMFIEAIANNCDQQTFDHIGIDLLMDVELFQRYIAFKTIQTERNSESKWILEAIAEELNKVNTLNQSESIMTSTNQTTQAIETIQNQPKETIVNKPQEQTTQPATPMSATEEPKSAPAPQQTKAVVPVPSEEGINWGNVAKTTGLFVGGAVVGAAGKWAWDHFFG